MVATDQLMPHVCGFKPSLLLLVLLRGGRHSTSRIELVSMMISNINDVAVPLLSGRQLRVCVWSSGRQSRLDWPSVKRYTEWPGMEAGVLDPSECGGPSEQWMPGHRCQSRYLDHSTCNTR